MNNNVSVVFIGGLTNGCIVYDYLKRNKHVDLSWVITYKDDFTGARFKRIPDGTEVFRSGTTKDCETMIRRCNPDLIIVAGWSEIIPDCILNIPKMGCFGFHPSKLPYNRGRSVLAWQIEEGYTETALTMFRYTDYPDGGDIVAQERIVINKEDYIDDVLDKVDKATLNIMRAYFPLIRKNLIHFQKQDLCIGNFRRLRGESDSAIDWNQNTIDIYNKIRAISHPYPGATMIYNKKKVIVWRSELCDAFPYGDDKAAGTLIAKLFDDSLIIKTRTGFLRITEYQFL